MNEFLEVLRANLLMVFAIVTVIALYIFDRDNFKLVIRWASGVLTEADGNGWKASISRVIGSYITLVIVDQTYKPIDVAPELMTIWQFSIGYMLLSKALSTMSPAILKLVEGYVQKQIAAVTTKPEAEEKKAG